MPYLKLQDNQHPLAAGETVIGAFDGAQIRLPSGDPAQRAVVQAGAQGVSIRRGTDDSVVLVNGVQLGVEPIPLLHGDRVEIAGHELRLGEDQKGGSTQFVSAAELAKLAATAKSSGTPKKPTAATGGRVVSLVDGREYPVADTGLSFGREVGNDVVISSTEISRKHATIAPAANGYVITDQSTNGVWVNGARVAGQQLLGRGDVIKMGNEEFRFYADAAKAEPAPPAAPAPAAPNRADLDITLMATPGMVAAALGQKPEPPPAPAAAAPVPPAPPAVPAAPQSPPAVAQLQSTMMGVPAAKRPPTPPPTPAVPPAPPAPPAPPPVAAAPAPVPAKPAGRTALATLEVVNEGPLKGLKFELHSALTNIGRGDHNDIAIKDDSISDSHAKLQKRADGWYVVDQESTNGTYVGGRRVQGEVRLEGAPDLRFGGIKMTFRPAAVAAAEGGGTRAIAAVNVEALRKQQAAAPKAAPAAKAGAPVPEEKKKGCAAVILLLVSLAGTGVGLLSLLLLAGR